MRMLEATVADAVRDSSCFRSFRRAKAAGVDRAGSDDGADVLILD